MKTLLIGIIWLIFGIGSMEGQVAPMEIILNVGNSGKIVLDDRSYKNAKQLPSPLSEKVKHVPVIRLYLKAPPVVLYDLLEVLRERGYDRVYLRFVRDGTAVDLEESVRLK